MENLINEFCEKFINNVCGMIKTDINQYDNAIYNEKVLKTLFIAYNSWQEEEHFGVDYIFNIKNQEDVICCLKGGLSIDEICELYENMKSGEMSEYFYFGENYTSPKQMEKGGLKRVLFANLNSIVGYMLSHGETDEYKDFYDFYISPVFRALFIVAFKEN